MLVLTDKVLREAGLDFDLARALLKPAEETLVVHVKQCLDAPAEQSFKPEVTDQEFKHEVDDGGCTVRQTPGASACAGSVLPPIKPTHVLPEHGVSLGDLRAAAEAAGCAVLVTDHGIELAGPIAAGVYVNVSAAAAGLNAACRQIANPPVSAEYLNRQREVETGRVSIQQNEPPIGHRTARMIEASVDPLPGETVEDCARRLQAEAQANAPPIVLLHPRGTSYPSMRLGDPGRFEE